MKQLWSIAKLTFRLPFRRRSGWMLLGLAAGVAVFLFVVCRSDGVLVNELRLRLRFALYFATGLLSLSLLWYACQSMRGDISGKRLHLVTTYPVSRLWIYAGKWLGLMLFGGSGLLVILAVVGLCVFAYIQLWEDPDEAARLSDEYGVVYREVSPRIPAASEAAAEALREIKLRGEKIPSNQSEEEMLDDLRRKIVRRQQLVPRNGERRWLFELRRDLGPDREIVLHYRFYAHRKSPVTGRWSIAATDDGENYFEVATQTTTSKPFQTHEIRFPGNYVRPNGKLIVIFRGIDNPDVVFYNTSGLKLLYRDGSWPTNLIRFFLAMLAHFAVVIAAGLTMATAFTLSVASFVSMVLFFVAQASDFFQRFLREVRVDLNASLFENAGGAIIRVGLFFTTGLEPPSAIYPLSEGTRIASTNLGMQITRQAGSIILSPLKVFSEAAFAGATRSGLDLTVGYLVYFTMVAGFGIFLLRRKELDRVH